MHTHTTDWTITDDCMRQGARTEDPRVVALLVRDVEPLPPDGDIYAPAYFIERNRVTFAGGRDGDPTSDAIARAYAHALLHFGYRERETAARYMRIFHQTEVREVASTVHRNYGVTLFDTPHRREHVGIGDEPRPWRITSVTGPGQGFRETEHDGTLSLIHI